MVKPRTLAYSEVEGGFWNIFVPGENNEPVHTILFEDGSMWDVKNGWRTWKLTGNQITHIKEVVWKGKVK